MAGREGNTESLGVIDLGLSAVTTLRVDLASSNVRGGDGRRGRSGRREVFYVLGGGLCGGLGGDFAGLALEDRPKKIAERAHETVVRDSLVVLAIGVVAHGLPPVLAR